MRAAGYGERCIARIIFHNTPAFLRASRSLIVDKPLVCQRGLPGRLSTHRPALTLARRSVAAHCASLRVLATSALRAFDGQRPGRECIFPANASICSAKNARNDVHAVISDLSLVLPILCQCSESRYPAKGIAALIF